MARIIILILLFNSFTIIQSQNVSPDYMDGVIYIKIKNSSDIVWPGLFVLENVEEFGYWSQWHEKFDIKELKRPFTMLKGPVFERTYEVHFNNINKIDEFIKAISSMPFIDYAEKKDIFKLNYTPNDPKTNLQFALGLIDAYSAFDIHQGGNSVIAIVDDAVMITHEDIAPNLWTNTNEIPNNNIDDDGNGYRDDVNGWDAADNDNDPNPPSSASSSVFTHGTHCAGIASAATDNAKGIASIGFNCKIMPVKSSTSSGNAQYIDAGYDGIAYAMASDADVISLSWGGSNYSQTAQNIFNQAHNQGITVVAAAGNDASSQAFYPAGYNYVISVASTDQSDNISSFSNYGNTIDICAPGSSIYSCVASGTSSYATKSGTSMACPMVAGLCGLLKSLDPNLSPDDIENCLKTNADNIDSQNPSYVGQIGAGRINAYQSIQCVNPTVPPVADFYYSPIEEVCPEAIIQIYDATTYSPDTWQWSFPGGTPASSTDQSPIVSYDEYGIYDVELIVTNSYGSDTILKTAYINVSTNGKEVFYTEDFESGLGQWAADNPDQSNGWGLYTVGGTSGGTQAAGIELFNYADDGEQDGLVSPTFDFTGRYDIVLDFDHAHRRSTSSKSDSLVIYVSTDNGQSYPYKVFGGAENGTGNFATNYIYNDPFTPVGLDDWCYTGSVGSACFSVDLSQFGGTADVKIKFVSVSDGGNNIYIDNVRLTSTCELKEGTLIADFSADFTSGCTPLNVNFSDISISMPEVKEWFWVFPGGTPAVSISSNPSVSYNAPGSYDVMLIASNGIATDSIFKQDYIIVNDTGTVLVLNQNFEDGFGDWTIINDDNDEGWEIASVGGSNNGTKAATVQFFDYNPKNGARDQLISPLLDLSEASNLVLSFEHAAKAYNGNYTDSMLLYLSTDSGNTYPHRLFGDAENGSGNYATGAYQEDAFAPEVDEDWCYGSSYGPDCFSFDLSSFEGETAVRIMFESVNDWGNNHYIDNINISGTCAVSTEVIPNDNVKIYPNPMENFAVIDFGDLKPDGYYLFDLSGRIVKDESIDGEYLKVIYRDRLSKGLYLIELKQGEETLYKGKLLLM